MARHNFGILPQLEWKKRDATSVCFPEPSRNEVFRLIFFGGRELGVINCSNGMESSHYSGDD